ncbi:uncharacterized protein VTP21DRAFT_5176 [Calcarisporiella thermophila]|uniref:uncharacterized protein n=1 Tax=Calcarisporiella thermophila TaxID=911321 RepID=UPI003743E20C
MKLVIAIALATLGITMVQAIPYSKRDGHHHYHHFDHGHHVAKNQPVAVSNGVAKNLNSNHGENSEFWRRAPPTAPNAPQVVPANTVSAAGATPSTVEPVKYYMDNNGICYLTQDAKDEAATKKGCKKVVKLKPVPAADLKASTKHHQKRDEDDDEDDEDDEDFAEEEEEEVTKKEDKKMKKQKGKEDKHKKNLSKLDDEEDDEDEDGTVTKKDEDEEDEEDDEEMRKMKEMTMLKKKKEAEEGMKKQGKKKSEKKKAKSPKKEQEEEEGEEEDSGDRAKIRAAAGISNEKDYDDLLLSQMRAESWTQ